MSSLNIHRILLLIGAGLLSLLGLNANAQSFPTKPINLVIAWPVGGGHDFMARILSKELSASMGVPVIVEAVPGAGGTIGVNKVLKAPADGYTFMVTSPNELILAPRFFSSAQYKAEDMRPIAFLGFAPPMLVARPDLPVANLSEFSALLKASTTNPLKFCSPGIGSNFQLIAERLNTLVGVKSLHVPYTGLPQCMFDVAGSRVDYTILPAVEPFVGLVKTGKVKAIALAGDAPSPQVPNLPLASATLGFETFAFRLWSGAHVSAETPESVVETFHRHITAALAKPDVRAVIEGSGSTIPPAISLDQARAEYARDIQTYEAIIKSSGLEAAK